MLCLGQVVGPFRMSRPIMLGRSMDQLVNGFIWVHGRLLMAHLVDHRMVLVLLHTVHTHTHTHTHEEDTIEPEGQVSNINI